MGRLKMHSPMYYMQDDWENWLTVCRHCSNYIFILNLTPGFNGMGKDNYKMRQEAFNFEIWCVLY